VFSILSRGKRSVLEAAMQRTMQSTEGLVETTALPRYEYILWSLSASWPDSNVNAAAGPCGDLLTSTARVKLATTGQILTHRLLHNSLTIIAQKEYGLERNRSGGLNKSTDLPQKKQSTASVHTELLP
jgi:hypothetical protein